MQIKKQLYKYSEGYVLCTANKNAIKLFKKKLYEGKTGILQVLEYIKIQIAI